MTLQVLVTAIHVNHRVYEDGQEELHDLKLCDHFPKHRRERLGVVGVHDKMHQRV